MTPKGSVQTFRGRGPAMVRPYISPECGEEEKALIHSLNPNAICFRVVSRDETVFEIVEIWGKRAGSKDWIKGYRISQCKDSSDQTELYTLPYSPLDDSDRSNRLGCRHCGTSCFQLHLGFEYMSVFVYPDDDPVCWDDETDDDDVRWIWVVGRCRECNTVALLSELEVG